MNYERMLNQQATLWDNPVSDGYGGFVFDAPVLVACRWEGTNQLVVDSTGREVVSTASVWLPSSVAITDGAVLAEGDFTGTPNPYDVAGSRTVKNIALVPNIKNTMRVLRVAL